MTKIKYIKYVEYADSESLYLFYETDSGDIYVVDLLYEDDDE